MKKLRWVLLGVFVCLLIAGGAYFWTNGLMDSLYAYRSPLHASPPQSGQPIGAALTRRVVFVLIDALREDTSLRPDVMPFLNDLHGSGAAATMRSRPPSYSQPSWTILLTGAWPDLNDGHMVNVDYADIRQFTQDDIFSAARRAGQRTAVSGYNWFEQMIPPAAVNASFYTPGEDAAADRAVTDAALPWLRDGRYQLTLIHIDQVDYAGHHEGGPRDPRWNAAARRADDLLREIAATLDLTKDTLFVCSDHGQIAQGGHGGQDPITLVEPWVLVGAGVRPGRYADVQMVDVAPTLAVLLGTNLPASAQGRPQTEMLALSAERLAAVERASASQQSALAQAYAAAIGRPVNVGAAANAVAATQAAMDSARTSRLTAERLPRAALALILALIPAVVLYRKRGRTVAWLLGGALLYMGLFNLRYAVLSGRTYSLSSVASANELILYGAVTAAAALVLSWLAAAAGLRLWRHGPRKAAELTLALVLTIAYLLLLFVLVGFALNGLLIGWTLPDFTSMFLAFLSGLQVLIAAFLGIVLAGLAAVVTWSLQKRRMAER
ncbi:MAG: alkaline phosphatase family protein [Chloroflexi bacterium]|nr:alkaline phosphatase family protein [Chloroflexota bacterium]